MTYDYCRSYEEDQTQCATPSPYTTYFLYPQTIPLDTELYRVATLQTDNYQPIKTMTAAQMTNIRCWWWIEGASCNYPTNAAGCNIVAPVKVATWYVLRLVVLTKVANKKVFFGCLFGNVRCTHLDGVALPVSLGPASHETMVISLFPISSTAFQQSWALSSTSWHVTTPFSPHNTPPCTARGVKFSQRDSKRIPSRGS